MIRALLLGALVLALSACAGREATEATRPDIAEQQAQVESLENWTINGRLGAQIGHEAYQATLRWHQTGSDYSISLTGPLGQGAMQLRGNCEHVILDMAGEEPVRAEDPEAVVEAELGWRLPLRGLMWWVRGVPDPGLPVAEAEIDEAGRLIRFRQAGWLVEPDQYEPVQHDDLQLPHRLDIRREEDHDFRLVISSWELGSAPGDARQTGRPMPPEGESRDD